MIVIVSKNIVQEEQVEKFKALTEELIEKSQQEEGCIEYELYQDINIPTILTFVEKWESQEAIDRHNNSDHFQKIVPEIKKLTKDGELNLYKTL